MININTPTHFVQFSLDAGRYALSLDVVERVVPALELTVLPNAPDIVLGVFNHQTHHRGQAHTLLTIAGGRNAAPSLDLILFQRSDEYREMR